MGQAEIQKVLMSDKKRWFSTVEIQIKLKQKASCIVRALKQMEYYKEVKRKKIMVKKTNAHYPVHLWRLK